MQFAFEHDDVLIRGFLDVLHRAGGRALVVDYKTNALGESSPEEIVDQEYRLQRLVYALACFRSGANRGRGRLPLPRAPRRDRLGNVFTLEDVPALEAELSAAIARIQAGEFVPTPSEYACAGLPRARRRLRRAAAARRAAAPRGRSRRLTCDHLVTYYPRP